MYQKRAATGETGGPHDPDLLSERVAAVVSSDRTTRGEEAAVAMSESETQTGIPNPLLAVDPIPDPRLPHLADAIDPQSWTERVESDQRQSLPIVRSGSNESNNNNRKGVVTSMSGDSACEETSVPLSNPTLIPLFWTLSLSSHIGVRHQRLLSPRDQDCCRCRRPSHQFLQTTDS